MKFVVDESVDRHIVDRLRLEGHVVRYVAEMAAGITDADVLALANKEPATLITADKDFGELVYRQHMLNPGVILIRLLGLPPEEKAEIVAEAIKSHGEKFSYAFSVITHSSLRIRRRET